MLKTAIRQRLEDREDTLSLFASKSRESAGRAVPEDPSPLRTGFQRDRDRIIHSKAFRRLKHKTQVFIAPLGDHYVTRLTHTLEVSQIARTIARALNLNEDLAEAIALGHDLGHTPFGHVGEAELDRLLPGGFHHAKQSLRIVEHVEKDGAGLNLTHEVRHGIANHSKPKGDFLDPSMTEGLTLEAQIVRISDAVAYLNHDLLDAFRAGVLREADLPREVMDVLGRRHAQRVDTMVTDIVHNSWAASGLDGAAGGRPVITMGAAVRSAVNALRDYMFENVYIPEDKGVQGEAARAIVRLLYRRYLDHPEEVPDEYRRTHGADERAVADYVSGMTDHYAMRTAEALEPGIAAPLRSGVD